MFCPVCRTVDYAEDVLSLRFLQPFRHVAHRMGMQMIVVEVVFAYLSEPLFSLAF